jgi:hypothetical protein
LQLGLKINRRFYSIVHAVTPISDEIQTVTGGVKIETELGGNKVDPKKLGLCIEGSWERRERRPAVTFAGAF